MTPIRSRLAIDEAEQGFERCDGVDPRCRKRRAGCERLGGEVRDRARPLLRVELGPQPLDQLLVAERHQHSPLSMRKPNAGPS